jgi:hypothetical protein
MDALAIMALRSSFRTLDAVQLDDQTRRALYISESLGHAFTALTDQAAVLYLCSTPYAPAREHGVHPLDPEIGIAWPEGPIPLRQAPHTKTSAPIGIKRLKCAIGQNNSYQTKVRLRPIRLKSAIGSAATECVCAEADNTSPML